MTPIPDPGLPEADLRTLVIELGERVKELECLYTVGQVLTSAGDDWDAALQEVVDAIPPGFQHPDRVAARLRLGDREWTSSGFVSTEWSLAGPVRVEGEEVGELEVCFSSRPPEDPSEPFLSEERPLLDAIADRIGEAVGKHRVEAKLRRSEEYFQTLAERLRFQGDLLDAVGQAVLATDPEGQIVYWNRAAEELYGWSREEALGRNVLDVIPSDQSRVDVETIMERLRRGESWTGEFEVRGKDGSTFPVLVTNAPVEDPEGGRLTGVIGVSTDLTDRIELEERLRQAERMEAIGRLAGGVAHDFNNILTVIRGHSEIVLRELPEDSPLREDLVAVLDGTRRATDLVSQLLAFGRRQVLDEKIVDLGREISEMESILRRLVPERIDLRFDLGEEGRLVEVDPSQLHQVVFNLVMNAADAIEGTGAVTVDLDTTTISEQDAAIASQLEPGEFVRLAVRDTGAGMLPGVVERIFEPFFTTRRVGEGSGLGLATVFGIVKQACGHVAVESEPGEGSVFEVFLPLAEGVVSSEVEADPLASPSHSGAGTVLVVEDEDSVRELIRQVLERAGYEVLVADQGERAMEIVERGSPEVSLVVSDIVMPGMGGGELIDRLRELRPDLAVVLISGYSHEEAVAGVHRKASAFLPKPFSPEEITRVVRETLER